MDTNIDIGEEKKEIKLSQWQIFMMGDKPTRMVPEPRIKYTGKILDKQDNILTLGVCVGINEELEYEEDDVVDISYTELKSLYSFNAKILRIRKTSPDDDFDIYDMINEIGSIYGYGKYIFDVIPMTGAEKHQRREFYRMPLGIEIYYKIINADRINFFTDGDLKFEAEHGKEMRKIADSGMFEEEGYHKLMTMDTSAGGFKYKSEIKVEAEDFLECILLIKDEALPAIVQVLSANPDIYDPSVYDIRASFYKISDTVRDRLLKFIFLQERQSRHEFIKAN
jgi:hypothetical protein